MTKVDLQQHQLTVRKGLWAAVKNHYDRAKAALNMTPVAVSLESCGLVVYEDQREIYCDGRSKPEVIASEIETKRSIIFLPFVEQGEMTAA